VKRVPLLRAIALCLVLLLAAFAVFVVVAHRDEAVAPRPVAYDAATLARGAYLARAGDCIACHTERGGAPYAGGRPIATPFGTVYASNLTPDADTGLGRWTEADFWRAMHHGRSRDGRLLVPAFPYPNFTLLARDDVDALFAYLRTLPAVRRANTPHALRFPYELQASLAVWRALYFHPGELRDDPQQSVAWNRGRYLVRGLAHCEACHAARNALGATRSELELGGGLIPMQNWYAPALAGWPRDELVALLREGATPRAAVMGPMAEVVYQSTQYLKPQDLDAVATYLAQLPVRPEPAERVEPADRDQWRAGERLYAAQCADCHGKQGEGMAGAYPALAGNRQVRMASPNNVIKSILHGGFAPSTAGNPRPYGMPPFAPSLKDEEVAAIATYIRQAWGTRASAVSALEVHGLR
jgi:mono/diheme cytochrome c family protein